MKIFLFSLAIISEFSNIGQNLLQHSLSSVPTSLMIVDNLAQSECTNQTENFVLTYSAPTVSIAVKNLSIIWSEKIESYNNPISAIPSQVTTQTRNKKLTNNQLDKLKKLIKSSGFMNLATEYGAPPNKRYYPYSISVCLGKKQKKVFYRSNPSYGNSPEAFQIVEDYLQQLIK
ncbi:hypothetical protein JYQ62_24535 [Nostoc sp. UHCC 0702]|nr:hypothetical protein JYQ62_24535 [Nostoc sp. UHCC 0702]